MSVAPTPIDGRRARWDEHNLARRQVILEAATDVLAGLEPGAEIHVRQIAEKAGLSRTVVYRHFADRADLDVAVQAHIFELVGARLLPALSLEGTPVDIVRRIVGAYVGWAAEHPALHQFVERETPGSSGPSPLDQAIAQVAKGIEDLITLVVDSLEVRLTEDDRSALDPLIFGVVGFGFTAVRRWLRRPDQQPGPEALIDVLSEAIWLPIAGLASARGVTLDPNVPVSDLVTSVLAGEAGPVD
ncbi:TetR/AcrR family transcriptional regulator [Nocardioides salsibiostraticola]